MLAKLIAFGPDRATAIIRLANALAAFRIDGLRTNAGLQAQIVATAAFRDGDTTTAFLAEHPSLARDDADRDREAVAAAVALAAVLLDPRSFRIAGAGIPVRLEGPRGPVSAVASRFSHDGWEIAGDVTLRATLERTGTRVVVHDGRIRFAGDAEVEPTGVTVRIDGRTTHFRFGAPPDLERTAGAAARSGGDTIVAPMPGKVLAVAVGAGDVVAARDLLVVLEAMKMEHRIEALRDGVVKTVAVAPGALVAGGASLIELEAVTTPQESTVPA
jgi:acetyl/propionyl-CoA carboxylase alpha subunit